MDDFKEEKYSHDFLLDLEAGLKKVHFMIIKDLRDDLEKYLSKHNLEKLK